MIKDITKIKQIRLIASDFNDVNDADITHQQYTSGYNCPIAKCMKRIGITDVYVGPYDISVLGCNKPSIKIKGEEIHVQRCRVKLANGAKYTIIKVIE